jgi:hypothetical protein
MMRLIKIPILIQINKMERLFLSALFSVCYDAYTGRASRYNAGCEALSFQYLAGV